MCLYRSQESVLGLPPYRPRPTIEGSELLTHPHGLSAPAPAWSTTSSRANTNSIQGRTNFASAVSCATSIPMNSTSSNSTVAQVHSSPTTNNANQASSTSTSVTVPATTASADAQCASSNRAQTLSSSTGLHKQKHKCRRQHTPSIPTISGTLPERITQAVSPRTTLNPHERISAAAANILASSQVPGSATATQTASRMHLQTDTTSRAEQQATALKIITYPSQQATRLHQSPESNPLVQSQLLFMTPGGSTGECQSRQLGEAVGTSTAISGSFSVRNEMSASPQSRYRTPDHEKMARRDQRKSSTSSRSPEQKQDIQVTTLSNSTCHADSNQPSPSTQAVAAYSNNGRPQKRGTAKTAANQGQDQMGSSSRHFSESLSPIDAIGVYGTITQL